MNGGTDGQKRGRTEPAIYPGVQVAESIGGSQAAKRLEIPDSSIWNWIRLSRAGKLQAADRAGTPARRAPTELEAENARLRRELADMKLDVEVLKKAAAYFARGSR